ncbi:hypothetical protein JCGZ_20534 [Jatropha curcas]|uniref:WRKY transcription factor 20 n=1 Tax=Jatropha curcas TaxID=180498 RepID=S5CK97_JATCU|nr:probable WRKY transcription factor 43 [Jatropha curcas]AGQ04208.1 WRKY transcription factor 20 [Jatropha curcas]KDP25378.1 hypothetical protein JCGZ_20534 [Jatropha curcas]
MDNGETPSVLLPVHDDIFKLKDLIPSTSLILPMATHNQLGQEIDQFAPSSDIDWVSLLSGSLKFGDQNHHQPPVARDNIGENVNTNKIKKGGCKAKRVVPQRIAFHTRSADDILDDGYRWRKYGQKVVKNSIHQRSYYRCTQHTCNVKKQIQRLSKDSSIVVTTYEGIHNHPCEKVMETLSPLLRELQFLSRI